MRSWLPSTGAPPLPREIVREVEITIKYQGYIDRQLRQVAEFTRLEERLLPQDLDYREVSCLRLEARQKLSDIRPASSVRPAASPVSPPPTITTLMVVSREPRGTEIR